MSVFAIAAQKQQYSGEAVVEVTDTQTPVIQPLVPCEIRVERITTVGTGKTPQLIYSTSKGRCSTLISKAQLINCCRCFLELQGIDFETVEQLEINPTGLILNTDKGQFKIAVSQTQQFLSRYNRVALEPLHVQLTTTQARVWNPQHQTVSVVNSGECTCLDWHYRQTFCKHQIAVQLCSQ